ncbi:MAG: efflux RND transporter periplasmic adaptor subunit [Phycisphaerales bacterium]
MTPSQRTARPPRIEPPAGRRLALIAPITIGTIAAALLAWSLWPVLSPAREVTVTQAVFDRADPSASQPTAQSTPTQPDPSAPPAPQRPRATITVQAPGWLEAEPYLIACTALTDGIIASIEALEGDRVEPGQVIARLVDDDARLLLRRAEAQVALARAGVRAAESERTAAEQAWNEPVALERATETGRAALLEAEGELARLPALIASAEASLEGLAEELKRIQRSTEAGATNEIELILARQRWHAQRADLDALRAREPILTASADRLRAELRAAQRDLDLRIEDRRRLDTASAALESARAALLHAEAQRDEAALELERMTITAPVGGFVQRRLKAPGDKVAIMMDDPASAQILHIYDPQRLQVRVDVPLADAAHVVVGQSCEVIVEVLPDRIFQGIVIRSTHEADLQKNTLEFKVRIIDPAPILRPEMLTRVKFLPDAPGSAPGSAALPRGSSQSAPSSASREGSGGELGGAAGRVMVDPRAIHQHDGTPRVYEVTQRKAGRGIIRAVEVTTLERRDPWVLITADLAPGALLAIDAEGLRDDQRVRIRTQSEGGAS